MNPYRLIFNAAHYGSLGWFNVAYRRGFITYEIWRLAMDTVYAETCQFITEGSGDIHSLYCWFVLVTEGF